MTDRTDRTDEADLIGRISPIRPIYLSRNSAMPDITAQFTLTGEDYEAYLRYYYTHTKKGRRQMRRMYFVGMIAYVWFMVLEYDHPKFGIAQPGSYAAYAVIMALLIGGGLWVVLRRLLPALAQGAVRHSGRKGMFTETDIAMRDDGMRVRTSEGEGRIAWDKVERAEENEGYIFLFMGGPNAFIIPKRAFDDGGAEAMGRIRGFMNK